jgi:fructose-1,6-bisphosphatase
VAVKQIAGKVSRAGLEGLFGIAEQQGGGSGDTQKKLDVVAVSCQQLQVVTAVVGAYMWLQTTA